MTIFESSREAFMWIWLPGEFEPVVAGKLGAYGKIARTITRLRRRRGRLPCGAW